MKTLTSLAVFIAVGSIYTIGIIFSVGVAATGFGGTPPPKGKPVSLTNICPGYTVGSKGDSVLIRCPDKPDPPWMTVSCKSPTWVRFGQTLTVTCMP